MKHKHIWIPVSLLFFCLLLGCSSSRQTNQEFEAFTFQLFCEEVSSSSLTLHYTLQNPDVYGITDFPETMGSFSSDPAYTGLVLENYLAALQQFPYHRLSAKHRLTYDILYVYFQNARQGLSYCLYDEPLSPITGIHAQLPILLAEYRLETPRDIQSYFALLEQLPAYFDSLIQFENNKAKQGLFLSEKTLSQVLEQCRTFLNLEQDHYLYTTFTERLEQIDTLTPQEIADYTNRYRKLLPDCLCSSYTRLCTALQNLSLYCNAHQGLCSLPEGKEYYQHLIRTEVGSSKTIAEIQNLIQQQMLQDLSTIQTYLKTHVLTRLEDVTITGTAEELLKDLKQDTTLQFPTPSKVSFQVKEVPKSLTDYVSPAFYIIPPLDQAEENTIYLNQPEKMDDLERFTTLAHEGYPGHLYQNTYFAGTNPDPIRQLLSFDGYTEGWATYAEMCSYSLLPTDSETAEFLRAYHSLFLGLYAMSDIGIHYHGWDLQDLTDYFQKFGVNESTSLQELYDYIVADPANYLKYHVGFLEILELKKGTSLSPKAFHKALLEIGPAPFELIEASLN